MMSMCKVLWTRLIASNRIADESAPNGVIETQSRVWRLLGATGLSEFQGSEGGSLVSLSTEHC